MTLTADSLGMTLTDPCNMQRNLSSCFKNPKPIFPFQNWIWIKSVPYGFNLRMASSRIVG